MTHLLGLTGSIGMGKSTTAKMFAEEGLPVWDADAAVYRLYSRGGAAVEPIRAAFPDAISDDAVSRDRLKQIIAADSGALSRIEAIVHPLVAADRADFVAGADSDIVVLDVPLLFETGGDAAMDSIATVSVPADIQRDRVLARPGMTEEMFRRILARQVPDAEKRARSDFVIDTLTMDGARAAVRRIVRTIRERMNA